MFKKIFALALILILVALCTRRPFDVKTSERLPNTCDKAQFADTVATLDDLRINQSLAISRIEATSVEEPYEYVQRWQREREELKAIAARAAAHREPRCLAHAKELFARYLEETEKAVEMRAPDSDFTDYRRARESAERIHAQYSAELKLQEPNQQ